MLIIILFLIYICFFYFSYQSHIYKQGEDDKLIIKVGESFSITLCENSSTGYKNCWLNESNCECIRLTSKRYRDDFNQTLGDIGSGGTVRYSFVGIKVGVDTLRFRSCPTGREHKSCDDFLDDSLKSTNEFIITVKM